MRRGLISVLVICAAQAQAATYYVATSGSNTNGGLATNTAWATLQHAVDTAGPGDVIELLSGAYLGARIESSGTNGSPITLRAQSEAEVVLVAPGPANRHNSTLELETWGSPFVVRHWVLEGLVVSNSPAWGIDARSTQYITIRSNTVHGSGVTGIFTAFCYDTVIEGNRSWGNGEHGIYHNNSSDRFEIRGNYCYSNANAGIHMNGDLSAVPPVGSPWVQDGMLSNGRVEGNIVFDNGPGGAAINMDGVSHSYIVNNVLTRSFNNSGIAVFVQNGARASHNNLIAHNSIGMHSSAGWGIIVASPAAYSNEICNNVCYTEHSWRGSIAVAAAAIAGLRCDYNAVMNRFSSDAGGTRIDLAQWRALGYGSNSILATPAQLYVTPSTDVHLRSNAPAIDAGCVLADVDADLEQRPRPLDGDNDAVAAADIGAYEFVHPIADTDGDGQPDRIEGVLGTDATDRRSRFAVRVAPGASNAPVLRWPSASGVTYAIDRASRADGAFVELGTGLAAEPSTNTFTVPGTNVPAAFFRVRAQSPAL